MSRSRPPKSPPPALFELETEVMEEMWRRDTATVRDVLEALNAGPKTRAYTTVMTIMRRLDKKGLLTRERRGKTDIYTTAIGRDEYLDARAEAEVAGLVDEFGDVVLAHFAREMSRLDPERSRRLRRLAEDD